jgi:hypothetical protein
MFQTSTFRLQACYRSSCHWKFSKRTAAVFVASSIWRHASDLPSWCAVDTMQPHRQKTSDEIQSGERAGKPPVPFFLSTFIHNVLSKMPYHLAQMLSGSIKMKVVFVLQKSCPLNRILIPNQQSSCNTEMLNVHRQLVDRSEFCLNSPRRP